MTVNMTLAWLVLAASVFFVGGCVVTEPYAPLRVKIAVVSPWAFLVANSPVFAAVTGT